MLIYLIFYINNIFLNHFKCPLALVAFFIYLSHPFVSLCIANWMCFAFRYFSLHFSWLFCAYLFWSSLILLWLQSIASPIIQLARPCLLSIWLLAEFWSTLRQITTVVDSGNFNFMKVSLFQKWLAGLPTLHLCIILCFSQVHIDKHIHTTIPKFSIDLCYLSSQLLYAAWFVSAQQLITLTRQR